jgi:hypothetical protein
LKFKKAIIFLGLIFINFLFYGQKNKDFDTTVYQLFRDKKITFIDYGYNTAPFSIKFKDSLGNKEHLYYRNNLRSVLGIGFSYKWFGIRFAFNPPGHLKSTKKYGSTEYYDLSLEFKTKIHFYDLDIHNYRGYALKNAYKWNDSLDKNVNPNYIQNQTNALSLSLNVWRFFNKNISISALRGKKGFYLKKQNSLYLKTTINIHGVSNNGPIIPVVKQNSLISQTASTTLSAIDFGAIPGFIHINKFKNWQISGMLGFDSIIQLKYYLFDGLTRSLIGIVPRYDFRFSLAYNTPKYFATLITEFDNKSIRFSNLTYIQTFYMVKLIAGIRFGKVSNVKAVKET